MSESARVNDDVASDLCAEFKQAALEIIQKGKHGGDPSWGTLSIALSEAEQENTQ